MVGTDGALPLPWLDRPLQQALTAPGHALLLHGAPGVGQFELAVTLAQSALCEAGDGASPSRSAAAHAACGSCPACRLVQARSHPDLLVLVPEALRETLGWNAGGESEEGKPDKDKASKAKPSREIKVDAVRAAVAFAQTTSSRGKGKVVVLHPAERINPIASNTLLKTLEEPPGHARFVLSCARPESLLATIRSRCQALRLEAPPTAAALAWLAARGVAQPEVLLRACGGQPLQVLQWAAEGVEAAHWTRLPESIARGEAGALQGWPLPRIVEALQKLCHDAICDVAGAPPRFFPTGAVRSTATVGALTAWARRLGPIAARAEHPWSAGLAVEALVDDARRTLVSAPSKPARAAPASLHSRP